MAATVSALDAQYLFKLLLIGDSGVGKSNILIRFADDDYDERSGPTIGVDFKVCTRTVHEKIVRMHIWDTAGQERFRTITASYYRGSHGIVVVYDITDRESFSHVRGWIQEIEKYAKPGTVTMLVGNKCDLHSKRVVSREEGQMLAEELGLRFLETSARLSHNIDQTFDLMCSDIVNQRLQEQAPPVQPGVQLKVKNVVDGFGCCT